MDVAAPVEAVWAAAVDWPAQGTWMLGTTVRAVTVRGQAQGARLEAFTGVGRIGFVDPMTITLWDPPHRCHVVHTGRVVRGTGVFEVQPRPRGARFLWSEDLGLPLGRLGRFGWLFVRPVAALGLRISLRRFARYVEAGHGGTGPGVSSR